MRLVIASLFTALASAALLSCSNFEGLNANQRALQRKEDERILDQCEELGRNHKFPPYTLTINGATYTSCTFTFDDGTVKELPLVPSRRVESD